MHRPVTYVLAFSGLAGGVKVVLHHVAGLRQRGWDAAIFSVAPPPAWWDGPDPGWRQFPSTDALGAALRQRTGVKVGTFVPHWSWVWTNLNPGDSGYGLLQDFDGETYGGNAAFDMEAVCRLQPIAESVWVAEEVKRRYGRDAVNVGIGLDPVYRPLPMLRDPLRVVAPARTHSTGRADLKGWDIAQEAVRRAAARVPGLSLITFSVEDVPPVGFLPHVHFRTPNNPHHRELFGAAGCVLVTSRHEGFGLVQAEALACAAPLVCTDAHGNRETCRHGETCLRGDGPEELAQHIARLVSHRGLAHQLGHAGRDLTARYRWAEVLDRLELLFAPPPPGP